MATNDMRNELSPSDQQVVEALIDEHYPFDCDVIPINGNTWAIHGPIPFAGGPVPHQPAHARPCDHARVDARVHQPARAARIRQTATA